MDRAGGERGVTAVTYALMVAIIAVVLVGGVFVLSGGIQTALNDGAECVVSPSDCGNGSGGDGGDGGNGGGGASGTTTASTRPASTTTTSTTTVTAATGP